MIIQREPTSIHGFEAIEADDLGSSRHPCASVLAINFSKCTSSIQFVSGGGVTGVVLLQVQSCL